MPMPLEKANMKTQTPAQNQSICPKSDIPTERNSEQSIIPGYYCIHQHRLQVFLGRMQNMNNAFLRKPKPKTKQRNNTTNCFFLYLYLNISTIYAPLTAIHSRSRTIATHPTAPPRSRSAGRQHHLPLQFL